MPEFKDYFRFYEPVWRRLLARLSWDPDQPHTMVEIGSYEGSSACSSEPTMTTLRPASGK